jgi:peptidyl-prolyl cis-trans isomerase D
MEFFRRIRKSKIGGTILLLFLGVIAFAFVAGDLLNSGGSDFFGPSSAEVAKVGRERLTVNELQTRVQRVFERNRQEQPTLTMEQFLAEGALGQIADELIAMKAVMAYGERHGIRVSKALVDAEIASNPAFADATGKFNESQFKALLAQQRVSEKDLRDDIASQIMRQQVLGAASAGARTPDSMVLPYAAMLLEQRSGELIAIPSQAFAPTASANEAELKAFYAAHPADFSLPEQRKLRYLLISRAAFEAKAVPTEAEIAAAYKSRSADYAAREARDVSQIILPTEAAAKALVAKAGGKSLAELAKEAGLAATPFTGVDKSQLAAQASTEIANAAFAAPQGGLVGPLKAPLGWAVLRVEAIKPIAGKTLEQAKPELIPVLQQDKAKQLFADFINTIDGKIGDGATLAEIAKSNNLTLAETPFLTADGRNLQDVAFKADETATALLKQGFAMQQGDDPQIATVKQDEVAAIVAPGDVIAAGPPPFATVRQAVDMAWKLDKGAAKARDIATKVTGLLNKGVPVAEALKQAGAGDVPHEPLAARRIDITRQGQKIPPPLKALFTMKLNSAQAVPMERNQGVLIVRLEKITQEDPSKNAQLIASTKTGLGNVLGSEYARQMITAIEQELKVTRNPAAIASVEAALRKANGAAAQ